MNSWKVIRLRSNIENEKKLLSTSESRQVGFSKAYLGASGGLGGTSWDDAYTLKKGDGRLSHSSFLDLQNGAKRPRRGPRKAIKKAKMTAKRGRRRPLNAKCRNLQR